MRAPLPSLAMPRFTRALRDWGSDVFAETLKSEIMQLETGVLPLDKGGSLGGYVDDSEMSITIISVIGNEKTIEVRIGVFFRELLAGCSCGDEPSPENAYCEIRVTIDKATAEAQFTVVED